MRLSFVTLYNGFVENTKTMGKNKEWIIITVFYAAMVAWWLGIRNGGLVDTDQNYLFGLMIGVLPILGGIIGLIKSAKWGHFGSAVGKSIFFLSVGLISWGIGNLVFAYYNLYLHVAVPYPSLADVAYIVSWPLWVTAMVYLLKTIGIKYRLKKAEGKFFVFIVPIACIAISYFLLITIARGGSLDLTGGLAKAFFDLAYPAGDIIVLTMAALIYGMSVNYLGGVFRKPIVIIILGFVMNYVADFSFSYTTTNGTFFVASWVDLVFLTTMFILSLGISLFDPALLNKSQQSVAVN